MIFDIPRNNTTQRRIYWEENCAEKLLRVLPATGGNSRPTGGALQRERQHTKVLPLSNNLEPSILIT
jgi:hypothetical protein